MRRALMSAGLVLTLGMGAVVVAQEHSGLVLCVNKVVNLPLFDLPDEPLLVGIGVSDAFKCPHERVG